MKNLTSKRIFRRLVEEKNKGIKNILLFSLSRFLRYSRLCYFFTLEVSGCKIQFSPLSVPTSLFVSGDLDPEMTAFLRSSLNKGDIYIDIGANVGTTTLVAAKAVGDEGIVFCFEPNKKTYKALRANIRKNGFTNALAKECALGGEEGVALFYDNNNDDMNRVSTSGEGNPVQLGKLDSYMRHFKDIRLIKIDVEGYEINVLRGAKETLEKTDMVIFESIEKNARAYGLSITDLITFFTECHFKVMDITYTKEFKGTEDSVEYPFNLVAVNTKRGVKIS